MEKFNKLTAPKEFDFYQIYKQDGIKHIHILGYSYESDDHWADIEACFFEEPLDEFIANLKDNDNYVNDEYCEVKQYEDDVTAERMTEIINTYFDGEPAEYVCKFNELTKDSPCGTYVNPC